MKLSKLREKVHKLYMKCGQTLYVDCYEVLDGKTDYSLDFFAYNPKSKDKYDMPRESVSLFSIRSWDAFMDYESSYGMGFIPVRENRWQFEFFDTVLAASTPYYMNQDFTLQRFGTILHSDVETACRYFTKKVLGDFFLFNVKITTDFKQPIDLKKVFKRIDPKNKKGK